jgi:hypothetical protein
MKEFPDIIWKLPDLLAASIAEGKGTDISSNTPTVHSVTELSTARKQIVVHSPRPTTDRPPTRIHSVYSGTDNQTRSTDKSVRLVEREAQNLSLKPTEGKERVSELGGDSKEVSPMTSEEGMQPPRPPIRPPLEGSSDDDPGSHSVLVGKVQERLQRTLMGDGSSLIGFSQYEYVGDPSIQVQHTPNSENNRYILRDPATFFRMLAERPGDFYTDCLNIIPIIVVGAARDALIEKGYDPEKIDRKLEGMVFAGHESELSVNFRGRQNNAFQS